MKITEKENKKYQINEENKKIQSIECSLLKDKQTCSVMESDINNMRERHNSMQVTLQTNENALLISKIQAEINDKLKDRKVFSENFIRLKEQLRRIKAVIPYIREYCNIQEISSLEYTELSEENRNHLAIEVEKSVVKAENILNDNVAEFRAELYQRKTVLERLSNEIRNLESNKIVYKKNVSELKTAIETEFANLGISSQVYILADLLEISDPEWQNAVEGYLNTQRFHIIVEPDYYDIAVQVYDRYKSRIHTVAVVNTAKLNTEIQPEKNTLACIVKSQNRYAYAYVCQIAGKVVMCSDVSELKNYHSAITKGCMLYHGNALRKIDPENYRMPYIGKYALQKQLKLKKEEYERKLSEKSELVRQKTDSENILNLIRQCNFEILKDVIFSPLDLQRVTDEINERKKALYEAEKDPAYFRIKQEAKELERNIRQKINNLD
ncbi:MAG: hypothetical protein K2J39_08145, partial [Ruminococcus sp.]|nr:hypothetical protein [Ruminococcus sp.]